MTNGRLRGVQAFLVVTVVGLSLIPGSGASAWPGDPDGTYGACGTTAFDVLAGTPSAAYAARLQSDGKVLVAGYSDDQGLVIRLASGRLDSAFGTMGRTRVPYSGTARFFAVTPTAAGGVVAVGGRTGGAVADSVIVRLRPNGTVTMFS